MPCISVSSASIEVNFGPKFQRPLAGFYGVNPTVTPEQKKGLLNVFIKYHKKGADLNDSLSRDVMKIKGVMELGNDVGCVGPLDPHVLLLAWKMRSKRFFEFFDTEWMVLWANEGVSSFDEIKATISRWITDIEKSQVSVHTTVTNSPTGRLSKLLWLLLWLHEVRKRRQGYCARQTRRPDVVGIISDQQEVQVLSSVVEVLGAKLTQRYHKRRMDDALAVYQQNWKWHQQLQWGWLLAFLLWWLRRFYERHILVLQDWIQF